MCPFLCSLASFLLLSFSFPFLSLSLSLLSLSLSLCNRDTDTIGCVCVVRLIIDCITELQQSTNVSELKRSIKELWLSE